MTAAPTTRRTAPPASRGGQPVWISRAGVRFPDLVPRAQRRAWVTAGLCPDTDLYALFTGRVREHPDHQALVDDAGVLSYAALDAEVRRIAALFAQEDLGDGDVVALLLPNGGDAVAAELAVYAIGSVALPIPAGGDDRDVRALLARSRARGAVLTSACRAQAVADLPHLRTVFAPGPGDGRTHGLHSSPTAAWPWRPRQADPYGPARILVSSGSEAEPKMVAYSHHALAGRPYPVRREPAPRHHGAAPPPGPRPAGLLFRFPGHTGHPRRPRRHPHRAVGLRPGRSAADGRRASSHPPLRGAHHAPPHRRPPGAAGRGHIVVACCCRQRRPSAAWPPPRHAVNGSAARW